MEILIWAVYLLILGTICALLTKWCDKYRHHGWAAFLGTIAGLCYGMIAAAFFITLIAAPPLALITWLQHIGWIK